MLLYDVLKKSNKGFTLVEMIAAVIIVGIIAALAAPNLLGMLNQARVKDGLGQVEGAIREALEETGIKINKDGSTKRSILHYCFYH